MPTVLAFGGDDTSLASLQDILEPFGHVLVAASSHEVVKVAEARKYDLLLFDDEAGGSDALGLIQTLLKTQPGVRLVVITSFPNRKLANEALEAGAHSLMRRPFEIGRILNLLSETPR